VNGKRFTAADRTPGPWLTSPRNLKPPQVPTGEKARKQYTPCVGSPCETCGRKCARGSSEPAAPAPPKPPVVLQTPLDNEFVTRFRAKFGAALLEAMEDRKQAILTVERARLVEIALHLRDEEKFDMLAYLTAVDCRSVRSGLTWFSICTLSRRTSG